MRTERFKMTELNERNLANITLDYWFLRDNGVRSLTAIFMIGIAYKEDIVIIGKPKI